MKTRHTLFGLLSLVAVAIGGWSFRPVESLTAVSPAKPMNILFIPVDDLNHWIHHLGRNKQVKTPNFDRLAAMGITFTHAYCAAPVCCPSRAATLSGLRPGSTGVYDNSNDWRKAIPDSITLPTFFRKQGYRVIGGGKIYHGGFDRDSEFDEYYHSTINTANRNVVKRGQFGGIKWAQLDADDDVLADFHVVNWAVTELQKQQDRPLFIGCGIFRPHMPWNVPKKYFDLYPLDSIELPPYKEDDLNDLPDEGVKMALALGDHEAMRRKGGEQAWREAIQAYMACISYADAQLGRLLDGLDKSPNRTNTAIVLWGDHGWHLGEKHHWRKFSLWEEATRAPMIWVVPGLTKAGTVCERPVDFMSIYPTLADVAGFNAPAHCEGRSLRPLLTQPNATWTQPAITTFGRNNHAIRTGQWRYIRYAKGGEELYDEQKDPYEWTNLVNLSETKATRARLAELLPKRNKPDIGHSEGGKE